MHVGLMPWGLECFSADEKKPAEAGFLVVGM